MKTYFLFLLISTSGPVPYWSNSGEFNSKYSCEAAGKQLTERAGIKVHKAFECVPK